MYQRKYLTTNSTQTDFTTATPVLANGRRVDIAESSDKNGLIIAGNANWRVQPMNGKNGVRLQMIGVGADNTTLNAFRVWGVGVVCASATADWQQPAPSSIIAVDLFCVGQGTGIFSAAVGAGGNDILAATDRLADTLTWATASASTTPDGPQAQIEADMPVGYAAAYSPGGDVPGFIDIPCVGHPGLTYGFIVEFDVGTATSANAVYELY